MIPREELLRVKRLASKANPRIKDWSGLSDRKSRIQLGLTLAEGATLVDEGLRVDATGHLRPLALLVSDSGATGPAAGGLFSAAARRGIDRYSLSDECFAKISGLKNPDGLALLLAVQEPEFSFPGVLSRKPSRWLVAAGVQDPANAGALARTALAAGCGGCLFLDGADPDSPKFLRGSMGAAFRLPCLSATLDHFLALWSDTKLRLVAADSGSNAVDYRTVDYGVPMVLVVGGEKGLPEALLARADVRAHIPLAGGVESLNLAVAAGIILFHAAKGSGLNPAPAS